MTASRPAKKSETLEVRLPHQTKAAFMARCRGRGQTASESVRAYIETELGGPRRSPVWRAVAAAVAGLTLGAVAAPSLARTATADEAAFHRLDQDRDGVLSLSEFRRR